MKRLLKTSLVFCFVILISKFGFGQCQALISYTVTDTTAIGVIDVTFFDQSFVPDTFKSWTLDYGDGTSTTLQEPPIQSLQYKYDTAGFYIATLIIESDSCSDTTSIEINACFTPVWPGDANNDKIANNLDILPLGLNFGSSTVPRNFLSSDWLPFCSSADTFGVNILQYADCTGDGIIDLQDVSPIIANYGLTHKKSQAAASPCIDTTAPELFFKLPSTFLEAGDIVEVEIHLGTPSKPADNSYGVVFSILYDKKLVDSVAGVDLDFTNSAILDSDTNGVTISKNFHSLGRIDGGISRTDGFGKSVSGRIGSMLFVLEDDLIQKTWDMNDSIVERNFPLSFSDITFIDPSGSPDTVCSKSDSATVTFIIPGVYPTDRQPLVRIYPNPTNGMLTIELSQSEEFDKMVLTDFLGREVYVTEDITAIHSYTFDELQSGSYILTISGQNIKFSEKVIVF